MNRMGRTADDMRVLPGAACGPRSWLTRASPAGAEDASVVCPGSAGWLGDVLAAKGVRPRPRPLAVPHVHALAELRGLDLWRACALTGRIGHGRCDGWGALTSVGAGVSRDRTKLLE
jgi:hypothetical protein